MSAPKGAAKKCWFDSEEYAKQMRKGKESDSPQERKKAMKDLMETVIENPTGEATMTDLYEIMGHTDRCQACKTLFGRLVEKNRSVCSA